MRKFLNKNIYSLISTIILVLVMPLFMNCGISPKKADYLSHSHKEVTLRVLDKYQVLWDEIYPIFKSRIDNSFYLNPEFRDDNLSDEYKADKNNIGDYTPFIHRCRWWVDNNCNTVSNVPDGYKNTFDTAVSNFEDDLSAGDVKYSTCSINLDLTTL